MQHLHNHTELYGNTVTHIILINSHGQAQKKQSLSAWLDSEHCQVLSHTLTHLLHELDIVLTAVDLPGSIKGHGCRLVGLKAADDEALQQTVRLWFPKGLNLYTSTPPWAGMEDAVLYLTDYLSADVAI